MISPPLSHSEIANSMVLSETDKFAGDKEFDMVVTSLPIFGDQEISLGAMVELVEVNYIISFILIYPTFYFFWLVILNYILDD